MKTVDWLAIVGPIIAALISLVARRMNVFKGGFLIPDALSEGRRAE